MIPPSHETVSELVPRAELSAAQACAMHQLLARHFSGVTPEQFARDLAEKNWVLLVSRGEHLVGFSTLLIYESAFAGDPVSVVYSGDTIVAPEAWGTTALPMAWIAAVNTLRATVPRGRYYWLLLTSGFRTYRFLPVFWRDFFPRFDRVTPRDAGQLLDHLARERFGAKYDSATGLVRFEQPQQLRAGLNEIPSGRLTDPHVAFFAARNPSHAVGDELVCLTELSQENLTAAGHRMVKSNRYEPQGLHC
jgi:hypothetical protein